MVIKRVGAFSCAKVAAPLYVIFGVIVGTFTPVLFPLFETSSDSMTGAVIAAFIRIVFIIIVAILYGFLGFVGTLIAAWLYNVAASIMGGIEIDVQ